MPCRAWTSCRGALYRITLVSGSAVGHKNVQNSQEKIDAGESLGANTCLPLRTNCLSRPTAPLSADGTLPADRWMWLAKVVGCGWPRS